MVPDEPHEVATRFLARLTAAEMGALWRDLVAAGCSVTRSRPDAEAARRGLWRITVRHPGWTGPLYPSRLVVAYREHPDGTWERLDGA